MTKRQTFQWNKLKSNINDGENTQIITLITLSFFFFCFSFQSQTTGRSGVASLVSDSAAGEIESGEVGANRALTVNLVTRLFGVGN